MAQVTVAGAVGVIAVLALLAGCSSQPDPPAAPSTPVETVAPEPSTEPDTTPEPTPFPTEDLPERLSDLVSEPVLLPEAREFTTDGAIAFAQYVIDATNWAYATGDAAPLLDHCSEDSGYCQSVMAHAPEFEGAGRTRFGGRDSALANEVELYPDDRVVYVMATFSRAPYIDLDRGGLLLHQREGEDREVIFAAEHVDGVWILIGVGADDT